MAKRENDLGRDPVGKLLLRLALPSLTAQLVNALYNIVDRMYIGHMEGVGDLALTGLGVCFPVIMFVSAISALVGMGGGSRAVVRMGEGKEDQANAILGSSTALLVVLSVIVTVCFLAVKEPMLLLFGATENTLGYASDYLTIYLLGSIFVELSMGLNFFITAQGFSTVSMATVLIGAATNIVLDPIFIFGFGMGVRGAALATILSQAMSCAWVLLFLVGRKTHLRLRVRNFRLSRAIVLPSLALGLSTFTMQASESVISVCFNASLQKYGGDIAVGAMTILTSVMQFAMLPLQGLGQGAQPIISYNYGAGNPDRVRGAFRLLLKVSLTYSIALWACVMLFPQLFAAMFTDSGALLAFTPRALRIYMACLFLFGIQMACQMTFTALGNAKASIVVAVMRKFVLLIPLIYLLPVLLPGDRTTAVYLAEPVADAIAVTFTAILFTFQFRHCLRGMAQKTQ